MFLRFSSSAGGFTARARLRGRSRKSELRSDSGRGTTLSGVGDGINIHRVPTPSRGSHPRHNTSIPLVGYSRPADEHVAKKRAPTDPDMLAAVQKRGNLTQTVYDRWLDPKPRTDPGMLLKPSPADQLEAFGTITEGSRHGRAYQVLR